MELEVVFEGTIFVSRQYASGGVGVGEEGVGTAIDRCIISMFLCDPWVQGYNALERSCEYMPGHANMPVGGTVSA